MSLNIVETDIVPPELLVRTVLVDDANGSTISFNSFENIAGRSGFVRVFPSVKEDGRGYRVLEPGDQVVVEYTKRTPRYDLVSGS